MIQVNDPVVIAIVVIMVVSAVFTLVTSLDRFFESGTKLKHRFVDSKFNKVVEDSNIADQALKDEIMQHVQNSIDDRKEIRDMLDRDKRRLDQHERDISALKGHHNGLEIALTTMAAENTLILKAVRELMYAELHGDGREGIQEAMNEMDKFLIEGRSPK